MRNKEFIFTVKKLFKLSTGGTAMVGLMDPEDYPIIIANHFNVELINLHDDNYVFERISEDLFSRTDHTIKNKFRSLQTFDNIDSILKNFKEDEEIILKGKRIKDL